MRMRLSWCRAAANFPRRGAICSGVVRYVIFAGLCAAAPFAAAAAPAQEPSTVSSDGSYRQEYSFKRLGAAYPLELRGIDGRNGVAFSVRADRVVTDATLDLQYSYSPALLPRLSHINVRINEEVIASLPVDPAEGGKLLRRAIPVPAHLITDFNRANVQLIGHYTLECEDPMHSSLWAVVSNESTLELTTTPIRLANDLGLLPLPFFDRRDVGRLDLPVVFAGMPDAAQLEAAGVVASWFGAQASYRGATFPVSIGQIPPRGNAVVFVSGNQALAGLDLPGRRGPAVAVIDHPTDRFSKLLVLMGGDGGELKAAASALALGAQALGGSVAQISHIGELEPRKPYDAPNWLRADRPVSFGELAVAENLSVSGYTPPSIRVPMRLPPDLFGWRSAGVPVHLKYRYTPRPTHDKSTLNISVGDRHFIKSLPLPAQPEAATSVGGKVMARLAARDVPAEDRFHVPLYMLGSQAQLSFQYYYDYIREGECRDVFLDNVRGHIDPASTIDISRLSHYIEMPDLAAFANGGFPFTRMADLAETAVVMPASPDVVDYSIYLGLMGRMGDSTGYPVTGVTVVGPGETALMRDKDLLVLGVAANQPLLTEWSGRLPFAIDGDTRRYTLSDSVFRLFSWLDPNPSRRGAPDRIEMLVQSNSTDAVLTGFESPLSARRSVVAFTGTRIEGLDSALQMLVESDPEILDQVQGSVVVLRNNRAETLAAERTYSVGRLNPLVWVQYKLADRPLLLVLLGVCGIVLLAAFAYLILRARARRRLNPGKRSE